MHNFGSLLKVMGPELPCIALRAKGDTAAAGGVASAAGVASLIAQGGAYLLVHTDRSRENEVIALADADKLRSARFELPALPKAELSMEDAMAVRKREAREAAAAREEEKRAAVQAATLQWHEQQAELAAELGITFDDWQRIVALLSKPPPIRVGGDIVMCSVAIGRAAVIDAAVTDAVNVSRNFK
eukprot:5801480-Prymnesium_polylepis.1